MQSNQTDPWFSYDGKPFKGNEPFYFDKKKFPWVGQIESQWTVIRDELMALIREHEDSMVPYPNREMTSKPNQWKTFGFMFWTIKSSENCEKCPQTWEILRSVPNVLAGSFNLLAPHTTIKPHQGDTNAIIRCHLGLVIPASAPQCAFRVGNEIRSWKEGEIHMFCDAHNHTSWNNTGSNRYIMVLDIMRPEYAAKTKTICSRVLSSIYLEVAYQRHQWLRRYFSSKAGKALVFGIFRAVFHLALSARLRLPSLPS